MQPFHVVLLQSDLGTERSLIDPLSNSFHFIHTAKSFSDLRKNITKYNVRLIVVDMEMASLTEIEGLSQTFPELRIICNHRLADEKLWMAAMNAGAADCCRSYDIDGILRAARLTAAAQAA